MTIAYPQDVNNAYSWVCIAPTTGTFTNPNATTYSLEAANGSVVLIVGTDGSVDLAVATTGGVDGTVVISRAAAATSPRRRRGHPAHLSGVAGPTPR